MDHVVMFSGGAGSWAAARRVPGEKTLVFADTLIEDEDLYRFLEEAAVDVGGTLVRLAEGRTPWEVYHDERFVGNTRADPCSKILKRQLVRKWLEKNHDPADTTIYLGIDWTEEHRFERAKGYWGDWTVRAPLCDPPYLSKAAIMEEMREAGIRPPRLYELGFPHNNCGGFCCKAGQAHFALLLRTMPERYAEHERQEEALRQYLGKDVSILRDRRGGPVKPLTLRALRERVEARAEYDQLEWGGCGCFTE